MPWSASAGWKPIAHGVALSACLFSSCALYAQSQSDQDVMSLSIEQLAQAKVFTASRHLEDSRQAPSSVSIIDAEEIRRYGWRTLGDVLNSLRGFYTSYDRQYTYLGVRGVLRPGDYDSRILLMVNGHRLNDNVYDSAQIGREFPLDLDLIDHIEIVRGPSSSLFGSNAVFGVINVITRQPRPGVTIEASGETSSFLGRKGRLTANLQNGRLSGIFSGSLYGSNGQSQLFYPEYALPETNNGVADNVDADHSGQVFGDMQYGNFRFQGLYSTRTKLIPTGAYQTNFDDSGTLSTDSRAFVEMSYHRPVALGDLDMRVYYDMYDFLGGGSFGGSDGADRYLASTWARADWLGTEATFGRQIGRHRVIVGADYEYSMRVDQRNELAGQPAFFNDHRQPSRAAVYGEAELNLVPKLSVRMGARLDWFDAYGDLLSPRVALVYSPNSRSALKYVYGRAFRAPNAYESYYADGVVLVAPSSPLKPETIGSHEIIFERGLTSWLQMTADGSYNHLGNLIDQVPDPASGLTPFVNIGRDRGRALELELETKRASDLAARVSYTLADAADEIQHVRLANSPLHMAKFNGTVPLSHKSFAALEVLYASSQISYQGTRVPSSLLTNVTVSTKPVWGGWAFSASCYNAFNRLWFSPAGPELRQAEIQQDGRTFRFKVTYRFHRERDSK
jgi:outer membrane receptor for ferrienterochelin and colicins